MGRFSDYYGDTDRLPEGMVRTGYDADEGRYYYQDSEGIPYRGAPYTEYGVIMPVRTATATSWENARFKRRLSSGGLDPQRPPPTRYNNTAPLRPILKKSNPSIARLPSGIDQRQSIFTPVPAHHYQPDNPIVQQHQRRHRVIKRPSASSSIYSQPSFRDDSRDSGNQARANTFPATRSEAEEQRSTGPVWPPSGWHAYVSAMTPEPMYDEPQPTLHEYFFDQDTLTFIHPNAITSRLIEEPQTQPATALVPPDGTSKSARQPKFESAPPKSAPSPLTSLKTPSSISLVSRQSARRWWRKRSSLKSANEHPLPPAPVIPVTVEEIVHVLPPSGSPTKSDTTIQDVPNFTQVLEEPSAPPRMSTSSAPPIPTSPSSLSLASKRSTSRWWRKRTKSMSASEYPLPPLPTDFGTNFVGKKDEDIPPVPPLPLVERDGVVLNCMPVVEESPVVDDRGDSQHTPTESNPSSHPSLAAEAPTQKELPIPDPVVAVIPTKKTDRPLPPTPPTKEFEEPVSRTSTTMTPRQSTLSPLSFLNTASSLSVSRWKRGSKAGLSESQNGSVEVIPMARMPSKLRKKRA